MADSHGLGKMRTLTLLIHSEDDHLWAEVTDMPGCFASGVDFLELLEALQEAVGQWLSDDDVTPVQVRIVDVHGQLPRMPAPEEKWSREVAVCV